MCVGSGWQALEDRARSDLFCNSDRCCRQRYDPKVLVLPAQVWRHTRDCDDASRGWHAGDEAEQVAVLASDRAQNATRPLLEDHCRFATVEQGMNLPLILRQLLVGQRCGRGRIAHRIFPARLE